MLGNIVGLHDWVIEWLFTYKRIMVKPSTFDSYVTYASNITCNKPLTKLDTNDIQLLISNMVVGGRRLSTIKHMLTIVRQSLYKAHALGMIDNLSMLDNIELPRNCSKIVRALSQDQVNLIINNTHLSFYGDFFKVLVYTGLRVGELIALRWSDVDLFNGVIHISNTDYNGQLQSVKTEHGCRTIPVYGELRKILMKKGVSNANDRVFKNTVGRPIVYRTVLDSWHRFCNKVGIYDVVGLHVLRHTFAHTALRQGIPVKVVSAWLGHADVRITLNIYDSVDNEDMLSAALTLEECFTRKNSVRNFRTLSENNVL